MKERLWIAFLLLLVFAVIALMAHKPKHDEYQAFADRYLSDLIPAPQDLKVPKTEAWEVTKNGVGPIKFGLTAAEVVELLGRPNRIARYGKDYETKPFVVSIGNNSFRFSNGHLVYASFQLKEVPNLTLLGHRVADLTRETYQKLPLQFLEENRQDVKRILDGRVIVTVSFIADSPTLNGKPFCLAVHLPPPDKLRK